MKKLLLITLGIILTILPVGLVVHGNAVYNTSQCIATFDGQNSLVCRVGGSSALAIAFLGLSFMGLLLIAAVTLQYLRSRKAQ